MNTVLKPNIAKSIKVVFVEDEEIINEIYQILCQDLVDQGYYIDAFFCNDIFEAKKVIDTNDYFDIIFCDYWLSSHCALNMLIENSQKIKKIFMVTGDDLTQKGLLPPQISLVSKPFDIEDIQYKIINQFD